MNYFNDSITKSISSLLEESDRKKQYVYDKYHVDNVVECDDEGCDGLVILFRKNHSDGFLCQDCKKVYCFSQNYLKHTVRVCGSCNNNVCEKCKTTCTICKSDPICSGCMLKCKGCGFDICIKCRLYCSICEKFFGCQHCARTCEYCGKSICKSCSQNEKSNFGCNMQCKNCKKMFCKKKLYNIKEPPNFTSDIAMCKICTSEYVNTNKVPHLSCNFDGYMESINNSIIRCNNPNCDCYEEETWKTWKTWE